jgi:hypothetical protein
MEWAFLPGYSLKFEYQRLEFGDITQEFAYPPVDATDAGIVVILLPFRLVLLVQRKLRSDRRKDAHRRVLNT